MKKVRAKIEKLTKNRKSRKQQENPLAGVQLEEKVYTTLPKSNRKNCRNNAISIPLIHIYLAAHFPCLVQALQ